MEKKLIVYKTESGKEPYSQWESSLDKGNQARITNRIERLYGGNFGDHKKLANTDEIIELRLDFGAGYRVYCYELDKSNILILTGGDKKTQDKDIEKAKEYLKDYKEKNK